MAITASVCDSYCQEILQGIHQAADAYMIAAYAPSATLNRSTTVYTTSGEVTSAGYDAGGQALVGIVFGLSGTTSYVDWTTDPSWSSVTFSTNGALVYNATRGNKACAVLTYAEGTLTPAGVPFVIELPPPGPNATIHIANP